MKADRIALVYSLARMSFLRRSLTRQPRILFTWLCAACIIWLVVAEVDLNERRVGPYNLGDFHEMVQRHRPPVIELPASKQVK